MVTKKLRFKDLHDFDSNNPAHWRLYSLMLPAGGAGKRRASMKHTVRRNLRVQLQAAADVYGLELPQVRVPSPHSCHLHAVPSPHSAISMCLPCACHPPFRRWRGPGRAASHRARRLPIRRERPPVGLLPASGQNIDQKHMFHASLLPQRKTFYANLRPMVMRAVHVNMEHRHAWRAHRAPPDGSVRQEVPRS